MSIFPKSRRAIFAFLHDLVMAALSFVLAIYLRVGDDMLRILEPKLILLYGVAFTLIAGGVFLVTGLYRGIWRYASVPDLFNIARAAALTGLVFLPVMFLFTRLDTLPRSFLLINWLVLVALLGGPRLGYRLFKDRRLDHLFERDRAASVPVLLISTKDGADTFIRECVRDRYALYRVVGMLSDTPSRVGRQIYGVPVLGTIDLLEKVVADLDRRGRRPQKLVITTHGLAGAEVRRLLDRADALAIPLARLPRLTEFQQTRADQTRVIEPIALEDLLGRPQAVLDRDAMARLIRGRRVLVTGAGGTIGSELARQVAALAPARLILLDSSEFLLYEIDGELRERYPELAILPLLGDVRDRRRVETVLAGEQPQIVFHAAALKHVPMVEANPIEGVLTNVIGTRNVAEAARALGTALVVMISTDKAVDPASVMGATKRLAESFCQALDLYEFAAESAGDAILDGAFRQCPGFDRVGGAAVYASACFRRTADRDASRGQPLFHDGSRGRRTGPRSVVNDARGGGAKRAGQDFRARHGRAGENRRFGAPDDSAGRQTAGSRHLDCLYRAASWREAA